MPSFAKSLAQSVGTTWELASGKAPQICLDRYCIARKMAQTWARSTLDSMSHRAGISTIVVSLGYTLQGMESKPAPGDTGTDSGSDDEAKQLQSAAEQELRNHRKRKADILRQKPVANAEGESEAVLAHQMQAAQAVSVPEHAGESCLPCCPLHEAP